MIGKWYPELLWFCQLSLSKKKTQKDLRRRDKKEKGKKDRKKDGKISK